MYFDFEVDGSDYKALSLRAAIYANRTGVEDNEYEKTIASIKEYIDKETSWEIVECYGSSNQGEEFNRVGLQDLINDSYADKFDIIVTTDSAEITESVIVAALVFEELNDDVPVFCTECETILIKEEVEADLLQKLFYSMRLSHHKYLMGKRFFSEKF